MQENLFLIKEGKKRESYEKKLLLMVSVLAVLFVAAACSSKPEAKINTEPYSDRQTMLGTYVQIASTMMAKKTSYRKPLPVSKN